MSTSPRPSGPRWQRQLVAVTVLAALLAAVAGVWIRDQYAVGVRGGELVIRKGVDATVLGLSLASYERTGISVADLPTAMQASVVTPVKLSGPQQASYFVESARTQAARCVGTLGDDCPVRPVKRPTVSLARMLYPHGSRIKVTWSGADTRRNAVTRLTVNGDTAPSGCPATIIGSGSCVFDGQWQTTYYVAATLAAPGVAPTYTPTLKAVTYPQPSIQVYPGSRYWATGERFCHILITVAGLAPSTTYTGHVSYDVQQGARGGDFEFTTGVGGGVSGYDFGWGYRAPASGWVTVTAAGMTGTRNPWGCS